MPVCRLQHPLLLRRCASLIHGDGHLCVLSTYLCFSWKPACSRPRPVFLFGMFIFLSQSLRAHHVSGTLALCHPGSNQFSLICLWVFHFIQNAACCREVLNTYLVKSVSLQGLLYGFEIHLMLTKGSPTPPQNTEITFSTFSITVNPTGIYF